MIKMHLNKSGRGIGAKTSCGRKGAFTHMSANWAEFKDMPESHRCEKCDASRQAVLNRKNS